MQLRERAHAKINWILRVFERRPDGFHRVETVMAKVGLFDDVELTIGQGKGITVSVEGAEGLDGPENIAWKAAEAYLKAAGIVASVAISIRKRIFVAAGLGGGSSDAAAVLRALEGHFRALGPGKLREMGARLGSDVPFFLGASDWALGLGRGEKITPFPGLPPRPLLLVHPGFPVSTKSAYEALDRSLTSKDPDGSTLALARGAEKWSDLTGLLGARNDLQEVVERIHPEIAAVRRHLAESGADVSQMSGSGGTLFGIFEDENVARAAERGVKGRWSVVLTTTGTSSWGVDKR